LATFGDSITFGYGVGDDDVYAHQLAARAELQGWDTINAGVTGFTSHQVLALVRRLAPRLHLDAATFCIGWNDGTRRPLDDRAFARRLRSSMAIDETLEHSYLYRGIKNLYLRSAQWEEVRATDKPRVSLDQYRENLRDIVRECRAAGIRPAFISLPRRRQAGEPVTVSPYSVEMARVAKELQVPLIGVGPLGADAPESGNVRCFVDSLHLSVEGHRVMAQEVARQLEEAGLLR
jgi:lysophospholipase L1-like esterase